MNWKTWTSGSLAALALAACSPQSENPPPTVADVSDASYESFMALANEAYTEADAAESDLTALAAAMPDYATLTWDDKAFDAATGATVFTNLALGSASEPQFGVSFAEAHFWGLDTDLLQARLNGERLDETGTLFTRLEATDYTYFGFTQAINTFFADVLLEIDGDLPDGFEFAFDALESKTERLVMTGVDLRPWELSPVTADKLGEFGEDVPEEALQFARVGQQFVAIIRSVSVAKSVSTGTDVTFSWRQPGLDFSASMEIDFAAAEDMNGFDFGISMVRGVRSSQTNTYEDFSTSEGTVAMPGFPSGFTLVQAESYESNSVRDFRLDKLMGYLARSEFPSMSERDLLSLGRWEVTGYQSQLNEREILRADRGHFNLHGFEWLIPTNIEMGLTGATLNTGELTGFFQILFETFMDAAETDGLDESGAEQMTLVRAGVQKAIDLLPEHGLDTLPFDANLRLQWAPDGGDADASFSFDADGFGKSALEFGLTLPDYGALQAAYESDDQEAEFETAFEQAFAFRGARFLEQDKGGYDKLFGFAHAIGKEYPDQGWGAVLGGMEPAQLRTYLGTMIRMAKGPAQADFPPAADWIESYATYLESGGTIEFVSAPPNPINQALMDGYDDRDPEPDEIVEIFGLTVTHTK